jgi:Hypothetical protein (DUF2513)
MKRDLELIRELFFKIEAYPLKINNEFDYQISFDKYTKEEINFNLFLMKDANFIDGVFHRSVINKHLEVMNQTLEITWEGFEFFDTIKQTNRWQKIKSYVLNENIPYSIIKQIGTSFILKSLE